MVLITGGTGAIGPRVAEACCAAGYPTRCLCRRSPDPHVLPPHVDVRAGDVTDETSVRRALEGVQSVIHLAALVHHTEPPASYRSINEDGTAAVVRAALDSGVRRLVFASTIAVYGPGCGRILDESAAVEPDSWYARSKYEAERVVLAAMRADGVPLGTVLRLAAVYGSRVKGNYRRLVQALASGTFRSLGKGANRRTLAYDKDVARALLLAMEHPAAAGRIYNVTDGTYHTVRAITASICNALGCRPPRLSIPVSLASLGAGLMEDMAHLTRSVAPMTRAIVDKYTEDVAVDGRRLQCELGFRPRYDLDSGWSEAISELRARGEL